MNTILAPKPAAPPANRRQRRAGARKQKVRPLPIFMAAATIVAGVVFGNFGSETATDAPVAVVYPEAAQKTPAVVPISETYINPLLGNLVDLDLATQGRIYQMCGSNDRLFCAVMAIASVETHFDPDAIGDGGDSLGLMQINITAQADRIERLGVTNLMDIYQNVAVAIDYINWLSEQIAPGEDLYGTDALYMAYNQGLSGSRKAMDSGIIVTEYSTAVLDAFNIYITQMGVNPA